MAAIAVSLHLRPNRHRLLQNPSFIHFFSSSSSSDDTSSPPPPPTPTPTPTQPPSSVSSSFNDVKASLKQSTPPQQQPLRSFSPYFSNAASSKSDSLDEVRKNLSGFSRRTTAPPPNLSRQQLVSFQELYNRNVPRNADTISPGKPGLQPIETIMQSLKQMSSSSQDQGERTRLSTDRLKWSFNRLPSSENSGPSIKFPSFLGSKTEDMKSMPDSMNKEFVRMYNHTEMGVKLRNLRPEVKGKNWFSLTELNERLTKLREIEDKEAQSRMDGFYPELKQSLIMMHNKDGAKAKKSNVHKLDVLGQLGGTPEFMLSPPQEHLVEKYFHPDNMSSGEKLKIELKKVRDEFKMSESDCGSARVVVAQLTTKIKHLSSVLHKKDKHSRKGLQGMVQQRKKLLKYLRRTDWDSYCFVLSRLGLRDNPDYKS